MDGNQIQEITDKGISYVDDSGQEQFIDFEACYENCINSWMSPKSIEQIRKANNMDDAQLMIFIERRKAVKEVGGRNSRQAATLHRILLSAPCSIYFPRL